MWGIVAWVVVAATTAPHAAVQAASVCEISGLPAPIVTTLLASVWSPGSDAVVAQPDCSYERTASTRGRTFAISQRSIQRVDSLPYLATQLTLSASLSEGGDFTAARSLELVSIESASASASALAFAFPESLTTLAFSKTGMTDLELLKVPRGVITLTLRDNQSLQSLTHLQLPASVSTLDLSNNRLSAIDFVLPPKLASLDVSGNPITSLQGLVLPDSLDHLNCDRCDIRSVRGLRLPRRLGTLKLGLRDVTTFEIRESDVAVLQRLASSTGTFSPLISQPTCTDATATLLTIKQGNVCVISDARFEELYAGGPAVNPGGEAPHAGELTPDTNAKTSTLSPKSPGPASAIPTVGKAINSTGDAVASSDPSDSPSNERQSDGSRTSVNPTTPARESGVSVTDLSPTSAAQKEVDGPTTSTPGSRPAAGKKTTTATATASSPSDTLAIVVAVVGTVLVVAMGVVGYRILVGARRKRDAPAYAHMRSPLPPSFVTAEPEAEPPTQHSDAYLGNDDCIDKALLAYRLNAAAIQLVDVVAQSDVGVLYRGIYQGETVAVQQMAPDAWRDRAKVSRFMDKVRVCLSLSHPKIVTSLGVSWTSVRDLAVVAEYMAGGDLHSFMQSQSGEPTGHEWSQRWTVSQIKSKTAIALDVAEALAYLHTRDTPMLHRDLKAKHVLLDLPGNAKLSGLGMDRSGSVDERMSHEVGAVAWIAPEILRGERTSAKADVYSLGVLLVELDRCRHPYAHEPVLASHATSTKSTPMMQNTRIAIMVSTGKLRPTPSRCCPEAVAQVIRRCLTFAETERPTALEVVDALHALGRDIVGK